MAGERVFDAEIVEMTRPLTCIVCGNGVTNLTTDWVRPWRHGPIYGLHSSPCAMKIGGTFNLEWTADGKPIISHKPQALDGATIGETARHLLHLLRTQMRWLEPEVRDRLERMAEQP